MFSVGQLVNVESRTWPGINQPGGVGRITGLGRDRVSIKYVLDGRHEKEVDIQYVHAQEQLSSRSLRNRSMLLGRCRNCGSLRRDCGSCDMLHAVQNDRSILASETVGPMEEPMLLQTSVESDDSLDRIDMGLKKRFRKFRKLKAMARRLQESSSDNDSKSTATSQLHSGKRTQARYKTDVSEESTASNDEDDNVLLEQFIAPKTPPLRRYRPRFRHGKLSCGRWARKANTGKAKKRKVSMIEYLEHDEKDNRSESNFDGEHVFQLSFASAEIDGSSSEDSVVDANLSLSHGKETEENVSDLDESILSRDHVENTESDFIQPEGDADELPRDVEDQTGKVPFERLPFFFDEKANVLEKERIPEAGAKIFELERRWSRAETMEEKETVLCEW